MQTKAMTYEETLNYNSKVSKKRQLVQSKITKNNESIKDMKKRISELEYQNHKLEGSTWDGTIPYEVTFDNIPDQLKPKIEKYRVIKADQQYLVDGKWCGISYPMNKSGDGPDMDNPRFYPKEQEVEI